MERKYRSRPSGDGAGANAPPVVRVRGDAARPPDASSSTTFQTPPPSVPA
jgi:hypothetical protein